MGLYRLYRGIGATAACIDWGTLIASVAAGQTRLTLPVGVTHVPLTEYWYGLRAVSDAGVEETGTAAVARVVVGVDGSLTTDRPDAVYGGEAHASPAGMLSVRVGYAYQDSTVPPATIRVAAIPDGGTTGDCNWTAPLHSWTVSPTRRLYTASIGPYAHGTLVRLAARAFSAGGVGSKTLVLPTVTARTDGPAPVTAVTAEVSV